MLDQDTAAALLTVADEMGARVALVGDRHQLPAVGRGGVLDLAARWVSPEAHVDLDVAHRFADPEYAAISLALRTGSPTYTPPGQDAGERIGEQVGERMVSGLVRCGTRCGAGARSGSTPATPNAPRRWPGSPPTPSSPVNSAQRPRGVLMMADTREQAAVLNGAIRDRLVAAGHVDDTRAVATNAGERLGVGDRVATRRNDRDLGVSNRDTWTITDIGADGSLTLRGRRATDLRTLPAGYARKYVELAYATTVYGAQGETTRTGHLMLGEHTSAASAYVAMTRGRHHNVAHLVADDEEDARRQWEQVFARDRADLGPAAAAEQAAEDIERYGTQPPTRPLEEVLGRPVDCLDPGSRPARATPTPGRRTRRTPARRRDPRPLHARPRPPERRRGQRQTQLARRTPAGRRPRRRTQVRNSRPPNADLGRLAPGTGTGAARRGGRP